MKTFTLLVCNGLLLAPLISRAQNALVSTAPARHVLNAPVAGPVALTFSQPVSAAAAGSIKVFGSQRRGFRQGTLTGGGSTTIGFQPGQPFAPGEKVAVSVPAAVASPARVYEFTAAAGMGTATFSPPTNVLLPNTATAAAVTAGDLDNDGDIDLVITYTAGGGASVYLNNGQGQFTVQPTRIPPTVLTSPVQLMDYNNDGTLDLVIPSNNVVNIMRGNSNGTFTAGPVITLPYPSSFYTNNARIAVADFNADGYLDIAANSLQSTQGAGSRVLSLWLNTQAGGFTAGSTQTLAAAEVLMVSADVNEDGSIDLVCGESNLSPVPSQVRTWLNNGAAQFTAGATAAVYDRPSGLLMGDFNGDGHVDLMTNSDQATDAALLLGTGAGSFQPLRAVTAFTAVNSLNMGDMDGDGDLDLLATNYRGFTEVSLNDGTGTFTPGTILIAREWFTATQPADLNGDGALDVVAINRGTGTGTGVTSFDVFLNRLAPLATRPGAAPELAVGLYPNPVHDQLTIQLPQPTSRVTVDVRNALGQQVLAPATYQAADGQLRIPLAHLAAGVYAVRVATAEASATRRITVE